MIEKIERRFKGPTVNLILSPIREGITDIPLIKEKVKGYCIENIKRLEHYGNEVPDYWYFIRDNIHTADADIQKYIDYEKLSYEEKQKLKQGKGQFFAKESMKDKPVTDSQKKYLIGLGYKGKFDDMSRYDASVFIEKLKN
jgi:hypothetical protein